MWFYSLFLKKKIFWVTIYWTSNKKNSENFYFFLLHYYSILWAQSRNLVGSWASIAQAMGPPQHTYIQVWLKIVRVPYWEKHSAKEKIQWPPIYKSTWPKIYWWKSFVESIWNLFCDALLSARHGMILLLTVLLWLKIISPIKKPPPIQTNMYSVP